MELFKKKFTTWKLNGKRVPAGTIGAEKIVVESEKYYAKLNGKQIPLSADKDVARKKLRKLAGDAELRGVGLVDPFEPYRNKPIEDHLKAYEAILEGKGSSANHPKQAMRRIRAICEGCGFKVIGDIEHGKVSTWLNEQRKPRTMIEIPKGNKFTPSQAAAIFDISPTGLNMMVKRHSLPATGNGKARRLPRATLESIAERMAQGKSPETINHYIRAIRGFARWLVRSDRTAKNPLEGLSLHNAQVDTRHARRELTAKELSQLLEGTRQSHRQFRGLTGEDRACLYMTAAVTGFRARALAHLTPADFELRSEMPVVTLAARFNKSKKAKIQPLPPEAASVLASYMRHKPLSKPVWGRPWLGRGAEMIRLDLEGVSIAYVVEGPHGPEYADFHALRHSYLTLLGRSGVDLRTAQVLAGHSSPVLTARYSHRRLDDLSAAVAKLPLLTSMKAVEEWPDQRPREISGVGNNNRNAPASPQHPPTTGLSTHLPSSPCTGTPEKNQSLETTKPPENKGVRHHQASSDTSNHQWAQQDSNLQPRDYESPDRTAKTVYLQQKSSFPLSIFYTGVHAFQHFSANFSAPIGVCRLKIESYGDLQSGEWGWISVILRRPSN